MNPTGRLQSCRRKAVLSWHTSWTTYRGIPQAARNQRQARLSSPLCRACSTSSPLRSDAQTPSPCEPPRLRRIRSRCAGLHQFCRLSHRPRSEEAVNPPPVKGRCAVVAKRPARLLRTSQSEPRFNDKDSLCTIPSELLDAKTENCLCTFDRRHCASLTKGPIAFVVETWV